MIWIKSSRLVLWGHHISVKRFLKAGDSYKEHKFYCEYLRGKKTNLLNVGCKSVKYPELLFLTSSTIYNLLNTYLSWLLTHVISLISTTPLNSYSHHFLYNHVENFKVSWSPCSKEDSSPSANDSQIPTPSPKQRPFPLLSLQLL